MPVQANKMNVGLPNFILKTEPEGRGMKVRK